MNIWRNGRYTKHLMRPELLRPLNWHESLWMKVASWKWKVYGFLHAKAWKDDAGNWHSYPENNWRRLFWV